MSGKPAIKDPVPLRFVDNDGAIRNAVAAHASEGLPVHPDDQTGESMKVTLKGGPFNGRSTRCKGSPPAIAVWQENKVFFYVAKDLELHIVAKPGAPYILEEKAVLGEETGDA